MSACEVCGSAIDEMDVQQCACKGGPTLSTADHIAAVCDEVKAMLLAKNEAYGDSALNPVRVFSKASTREQILVRLDDKLSRLARGSAAGEDVVLDLVGYLVLLRIADRVEASTKEGR